MDRVAGRKHCPLACDPSGPIFCQHFITYCPFDPAYRPEPKEPPMTDPKTHPDLGDPLTNDVLGTQVRQMIEQQSQPAEGYKTIQCGRGAPVQVPNDPPDESVGPLADPPPGESLWTGLGVEPAVIAGLEEELMRAIRENPERGELLRRSSTAQLAYYRQNGETDIPELMRDGIWMLAATVLPELFQVSPMSAPVHLLSGLGRSEHHPVVAVNQPYQSERRGFRRVELDHGVIELLLSQLPPPEVAYSRAAVLDDGPFLLPASFRRLRTGQLSSKAAIWVVTTPALASLWLPDYELPYEGFGASFTRVGSAKGAPDWVPGREVRVYVDTQLPAGTALWGFHNGPTDAGAAWCPYQLLIPGPAPIRGGTRAMRRRHAFKLLDPRFYVRWTISDAPPVDP